MGEIKDYSKELNYRIIDEISYQISLLKKKYDLTDNEIADILGITIDKYHEITNNSNDIDISTSILSTILILNECKFDLVNLYLDTIEQSNFDFVTNELENLKKERLERKLKKVFDLLDISNEKELDQFLENYTSFNIQKN